ncbi:uncharacterized protein LOC134264451 [Saccostrea cucullata]|uniref:uncharacterized protein LOC134264451 n=1 Tax=Saccostrea cuccullata TaxID=36930 RepID=UPI002ED57A01
MAEGPDPRGQHFVTCQLCDDNVQFYCRPCKIRLCVKCVSPHLETNAPDHNIVYYHKRLGTTARSLHDPQINGTILCGYHAMLCIRYAGKSRIFVSSHVSRDIKLFHTNGTLLNTLTPSSLAMYLTPYEDGVLYTGTGGIRKINHDGDQLFLPLEGNLTGIKFVEPNTIYVCKWSEVEKRTTGGKKLLSIKYNDQGDGIYGNAENISINGNGDICVAEYDAAGNIDSYIGVTVVDENGKYRFSYSTKPPSWPMDLCCDSDFQIIIAFISSTIHVIDKDGHFLRKLEYSGIDKPWSVTIDNRDNLFVSQMHDDFLRMVAYMH